jgi:hypothetical protein
MDVLLDLKDRADLMTSRILSAVSAFAIALTAPLALAPAAVAVSASATLTGGTLAFVNSTPSAVTFPSTTLDGTNKTVSQTQNFDVSDARGTGAGWNITATSTTFTSGSDTLPTTAATIASAPGATCDSGVTCTTATASGLSFPYTLPAAATAPTATKLFNAAANSGMAAQTLTPTWTLAVPAAAKAGTYTSTWTFSLTSGP